MIRLLFWILPLLAASMAHAAVVNDAAPPVTRFAPDLDVYPQNFSVAIDRDNRVFIGNSDGVLIFDGESWQLIGLPNGDIVRWLEADGDGRIYVGGYDAFGFLDQDAAGRFVYTELSTRFADELGSRKFADIWQIVVHDDAVYYLALEHVFRFEPATGNTQMWLHEGSIGAGVSFGGRVYVQFRNDGFKYFDNGNWKPVEGSPDLSKTLLASIVPVSDSEVIIVSADGPWYRFDGQRFEPITSANKIPFKASITRAVALDASTVAMATQLGQIVIFDLGRGTSEVVRASSGFLPALATSRQNDLVGVDDLGFFTLPWPAKWRRIGAESGLAGGIHRILEAPDGDNTYVMSSSGAFMKTPGLPFERLTWTDHEAWDLLPLEDGSYLFADSYELKHLHEDGSVTVIDNSTTGRVFAQSRFDPNVVYVGTEYGLQVLVNKGGQWRSVVHADEMDALRVTNIIEVSPDEIWVGSERGGIRRLKIARVPEWRVEDEVLGASLGLEYGAMEDGAHLFANSTRMLASTSAGIFEWNGERFNRTSLGGLEQHRLPGRPFRLLVDGDDRWAWDYARVFYYDRSGGGWVEEDVGTIKSGAINVLDRLDHCIVVGTLGTLLLNEQIVTLPAATAEVPSVRLTEATQRNLDGTNSALALNDIRYQSDISRITLRYALSDLVNPSAVRYRTRLLPSENEFSPWTEDSQQSFVQLDPGDYQLEIEAMDSGRDVSRLLVPITVIPQWHETLLARTALLVLFVLAIVAFTVWLSRRRSMLLERERDRLEQVVTERTRALRSANQQLERMAHLDGLTQIPNRRRLDSYLDDVRQQCVERGRIMAVALIDVDHFKQYNDTHGHQAGDALLIELARLLSRNLRRAEDLVARYGGEEFLVVMPGAGDATGMRVIESMRQSVEDSDLGVTISAGLHSVRPDESIGVEEIVAAADAAMYHAKHSGRNRVVCSSSEGVAPMPGDADLQAT